MIVGIFGDLCCEHEVEAAGIDLLGWIPDDKEAQR